MKKIDLKFEIKAMGIGFFIPIIIIVASIMHLFYQMKAFGVTGIGAIIPKLEFFIIPSIGIWVIYLFYEYYENNNLEVLLSYPIKDSDHTANKIFIFILLFLILLIPIFILGVILGGVNDVWLLIMQVVPQIIFVAGLITIITVICKNIGVGLSVLIGYTSIELLTEGKVMPWYHLFYFNTEVLGLEELIGKSIINIVFGVLFLIISIKMIRRLK